MTRFTIEQRLQTLEDIEEIRRLKARYCAACDDDHDPDAVSALFTGDAVWDAPGIGRCEGRAAIRAYMAELRASGRIRNSAHHAINPLIEVDGDSATGHWRLIMLYTANAADGGTEYHRIIGWYRERYRRVAGRWLIEHLFCQVEENGPYRMQDAADA